MFLSQSYIKPKSTTQSGISLTLYIYIKKDHSMKKHIHMKSYIIWKDLKNVFLLLHVRCTKLHWNTFIAFTAIFNKGLVIHRHYNQTHNHPIKILISSTAFKKKNNNRVIDSMFIFPKQKLPFWENICLNWQELPEFKIDRFSQKLLNIPKKI